KGFSSEKQRYGFSLTQAMVQTLNSHVLYSLHQHKLPAVSLPAHSLVSLSNHHLENIALDVFRAYVKNGFLPVTYGDVALDSTLGFSICSGDLLMWSLAKTFQPEKIIFVMDEDGVYDKNPKKYADAKLIETIQRDEIDSLQTSLDEHADVTEGMAGKLQTIKKITALHIDTILVNGLVPNRLYQVLSDQSTVHTVVKG
ncbi:MAG: kinase, partial [Candidatus Thermoplasmatota archaeon]|nr:kinase [Candidatus Thermoplasmatota archaeon]